MKIAPLFLFRFRSAGLGVGLLILAALLLYLAAAPVAVAGPAAAAASTPASAPASASGAVPAVIPVTRYKIATSEEGVNQVTYSALTAAGFDPTGIATSTFQLFFQEQEVTIFLFDGGDDRFDPGDSFIFFAEALQSRYTRQAIYWFVAGEQTRQAPVHVAGAPGAAAAAAATWRTLHFEENLSYQSGLPLSGEGIDRWYWRLFAACAPGSRTCTDTFGNKNARTFTLNVQPPASSVVHTATLLSTLRGSSNEYQNPDHHILTSLNGTQLSDAYYEGLSYFVTQMPFTSSLLAVGANTVKLDVPYDLGSTVKNEGYVDYFKLTYRSELVAQNNMLRIQAEPGTWRYPITGFTSAGTGAPVVVVLDITDPLQPKWVDGVAVTGSGPFTAEFEATSSVTAQQVSALPNAGASEYFIAADAAWKLPVSIAADTASTLRSVQNGADYIVISHAAFLAPAQQLAAYRAAANGYRTMAIDVQNVYDEFNGGMMSPEAIRDFIFYASHFWQPPRPSYVVLMGDGHYDFLNYRGANETVFMPPWMAAIDPFQGETAADNRYVDIFGDDQYDSDGDDTHTIRDVAITNGHMALAADFGYVLTTQMSAQAMAPASAPAAPHLIKAIGDMVFLDEDLDGVWDANERGMPGVTVNLWESGVPIGALITAQVTDGEGAYSFEDIPSGVYEVEFVRPSGWQFTLRDVGSSAPTETERIQNDRYDSDADLATGFTVPITYTFPETAKSNWDAGLAHPGTVGDRVWEDINGNGLQDTGEPGLAGVVVELLHGGTVISTTTTNANGYYYFMSLPDGVYDIQIAAANFAGVLAGYGLTIRDQGFDGMPDLRLGRFPVQTLAQAQEMVNRTIAYETTLPGGDWQKNVVFVADDPDAAGNFYEHSNHVADHIWPYPADSTKVYYKSPYATSTDMKNIIKAEIDQGALFVTYNGHSTKDKWGEGFMDATLVAQLNNTVFPIFLPMTCLEGQFSNPAFTSMGEASVRTPGRGAVASFSPTSLGVATGHQFLYDAFFQGVVSGQGDLGALTVLAKQALFESHSQFKDLLDAYILFGDPALTVRMPSADPAVSKRVSPAGLASPGQTLTYTLHYTNTGGLAATQVVLTDTLPAGLINPTTTSVPPVVARAGSTYIWNLGDLQPGQSGVITITATIDPSLSGTATLVNTAVIGAASVDGVPGNSQASVSTPVGAPVTLGGWTWYDVDVDGDIDPTEATYLHNVLVTAVRQEDGATFTAISSNDGYWEMNDLPPGVYEVSAATPPGLLLVTTNPQTVNMPSGGANTAVNFGYISPTAISLVSFNATMSADAAAVVTWMTAAAGREAQGFYVRRSIGVNDHGKRVSPFIAAMGAGVLHEFRDVGASGSGYFYWLEAIAEGGSEFFGPVAARPDSPNAGYRLFLQVIRRN